MTVSRFFGCLMLAFGPPFAMFCMTVACDPVKIILMVCASFACLQAFCAVSICWALLGATWGQYLAVGAALSVVSQEISRYIFHIVATRAHNSLKEMMNNITESNADANRLSNPHPNDSNSRPVNPIDNTNDNGFSDANGYVNVSGSQILESTPNNQVLNIVQQPTEYKKTSERLALGYVSGLGFGIMSGVFAFANVLVDSLGPATTGLHGDSQYHFIVSALTTLAFILLNVCWSVLTSEGIARSDPKLIAVVVGTHLLASSATFLNRLQYQIVSLVIVNAIMIVCGIATFEIARLRLAKSDRSQ